MNWVAAGRRAAHARGDIRDHFETAAPSDRHFETKPGAPAAQTSDAAYVGPICVRERGQQSNICFKLGQKMVTLTFY
jgi:hypothetical protein